MLWERAATFGGEAGFKSMKTALKILLGVVLALVAIKLLPILLIPVGIGLIALLVIAGLLLAAVVGVAGTGLTAVAVIAGILLALAAVLAPIWLPVLAVLGIVALVKRSRRTKTPEPVPSATKA